MMPEIRQNPGPPRVYTHLVSLYKEPYLNNSYKIILRTNIKLSRFSKYLNFWQQRRTEHYRIAYR